MKSGITKKKKDTRESAKSSWVYSVGIPDTERMLGDERESRDKKDNRGESKVRALGPSKQWKEKALVFGPVLNQKLNRLTCRTRGLEECWLY